MTAKEKAMEIADEIGKPFSGCYTSDQDCYDSAMQMHEWTKNELLFILDNSYELRKKVCRSELSFADCTELVKRLKKIVEEEL